MELRNGSPGADSQASPHREQAERLNSFGDGAGTGASGAAGAGAEAAVGRESTVPELDSSVRHTCSSSRVPPAVLKLRSVYSSPKLASGEIRNGIGGGGAGVSSSRSHAGVLELESDVLDLATLDGPLADADSTKSLPRPHSAPKTLPPWRTGKRAPTGAGYGHSAAGRAANPHVLTTRAFTRKAQKFEQQVVARHSNHNVGWKRTLLLAYATLGTIYGDIGTSTIYAIPHVLGVMPKPTELDLLGIASLCFWMLTLSPLIKYCFITLYADDIGEGGIFALYSSLCRQARISLLGSKVNRDEADSIASTYSISATSPAWRSESRASSRCVPDGSRKPSQHHPQQRPVQQQEERQEEKAVQDERREQGKVEIEGASKVEAGEVGRTDITGQRPKEPERESLVNKIAHHWAKKPNPVATEQAGEAGRTQEEGSSGGSFVDKLVERVKGVFTGKGHGPAARAFLERSWRLRQIILVLALVGTCGVLADAVLTPAISVLSAIDGLGSAGIHLSEGSIVAITCGILVLVFLLQQLGTHRIAFIYSPVVLVWYLTLASIGLYNIVVYMPDIFKVISPWYSFNFLITNGFTGWVALGQIILVITGAEALFTDMGHFSRASIQLAFTTVVYPSATLAYLGQTAYLIHHPEDYKTPFFSSVPSPLYWPVFIVATLATVVASQALITGSFSAIKHSMALDCFPRIKVIHTSEMMEGQVYVPAVNWTLMVLTIAVVAGFRDSYAIGNAYGTTVAMVMIICTTLVAIAMVVSWDLSLWLVIPFWLFYTIFEGVLFSSTLYKIPYGAWFPLAVSAVLLVLMYTTHYGAFKKRHYDLERNMGEQHLYTLLSDASSIEGVAVVYSEIDEGVPPVLIHYLANVPALQKVVICLTVKQIAVPRLDDKHRMLIAPMGYRGQAFPGFYRVIVYYGYTETWDHGQKFLSMLYDALVANITARSLQPILPGEAVAGQFRISMDVDKSYSTPLLRIADMHAADSVRMADMEPVLSTKSWKLPVPGSSLPISSKEEMNLLLDAWQYNQVFFFGRTTLAPRGDASLATKLLVPAYRLLKLMTSSHATMFGVPTDRLLEVGMVYEVL